MGAVEAIGRHASEALKGNYLEKLVSGEWMGTMNLTEPQAGSDLDALRARAEPGGTVPIAFSARRYSSPMASTTSPTISCIWCLRGCPRAARHAGHLAISGTEISGRRRWRAGRPQRCLLLGDRGKLGIHASPTCTMIYGDGFAKDRAPGAIGWLIGEENRGLACMFTMMNNARLCCRHAGRGRRRDRVSEGARLCQRAAPGQGAGLQR